MHPDSDATTSLRRAASLRLARRPMAWPVKPMQHVHTRPVFRRHRAKTSEDILQENRVLKERVRELEALLSVVALESDLAIEHPEIALLVACRMGTLARGLKKSDLLQR